MLKQIGIQVPASLLAFRHLGHAFGRDPHWKACCKYVPVLENNLCNNKSLLKIRQNGFICQWPVLEFDIVVSAEESVGRRSAEVPLQSPKQTGEDV